MFYESYKDDEDMKMVTEWNENEEEESDKMKYSKLFVSNPLVRYAIYKKVDASSSGKHYVKKLQPMLQFLCEHHLQFDDEENLENLYQRCVGDKLFDCTGLVRIRGGKVEYFWSEYLCNKLVDDYLGFGVRKFVGIERGQMLQLMEYIIANGVGNRLDETVMPRLKGEEYTKHEDVGKVLATVDSGMNVWRLKKMQKNEMLVLFENVCAKQIDLPHYLCVLLLSFVVL